MKLFLINILILLVLILAGFTQCRRTISSSEKEFGEVVEIRYIHDLSLGTELTANKAELLLSVVRVVIVENARGGRTILVGEASESNSGIYYMGIDDDHLQFRLIPGDESGTAKTSNGEILKFPRDTRILNLWGSILVVVKATPDEIRCRVADRDPPTSI
jgi:hypothetical protein